MSGPGTSGASRPATLERLQAPNLRATSAVTLGGQSFGGQTSTGLLAGHSTAAAVTAGSGGYVITLPPASAALLTA